MSPLSFFPIAPRRVAGVARRGDARRRTAAPLRAVAAFVFVFVIAGASSAEAALNVVACEPEWAALAKELGGDKLNVTSATGALQDPHRVEARPSLVARMRGADLVVCTGMELEVGWLPVLIQQSGNARLAPGAPAYFEAGRSVVPLDVPTRLDRSDGDVHAQGNPHIQLDPRNIAKVAAALADRLGRVDPSNAALYRERLQAFQARWAESTQRWEGQAAPLKGIAVVAHHKNMSYLWNWLGIREVATLEPKPGVEPSAGHLAELGTLLAREPAKLVVRAAYEDARASRWLVEHARIKAVALPFTVGGNAQAVDLFGLFDSTVALLLEAAR